MPIPQYPPDMASWMQANARSVINARNQALSRNPLTRIKAKALELLGNLVIKSTGYLAVFNSSDQEIVKMGYLGSLGDEEVWGFSFHRPDGTEAMRMYSSPSGANTYTCLLDRHSNIIVSDDGLSGQGLARPWMPYATPMLVEPLGGMPSTDQSAWTTVAESWPYATHPRLSVYGTSAIDVVGSDETSGEIRLMINGTQVGDAITAGGTFTWYEALPGWADTVNYLDQIKVEIQARKTNSVTGRIYAQVLRLYGTQS